MSRTVIIGGPGCGKSTLAHELAGKYGCLVLCTDTFEHASKTGRAFVDGTLYAPSALEKDWSGLSLFVASQWLTKPGPWVIEGVAAIRALRKYRDASPDIGPPCDRAIWCHAPLMDLTPEQERMLVGHDTIANGLLEEWPELFDLLEIRSDEHQ